MSVTASFSVSQKERVVQEVLEAKLEPSEVLLGFTQARHNPGGLADKVYDVGLTRRRLLLVRKDEPLRVYSIYYPFINKLNFVNMSLTGRRGLKLQLEGEALTLATQPAWNQRAGQMAQEYARREMAPLNLTSMQVLAQVGDMMDLGLLAAAQKLLRARMADDPVMEIEPAAAALDRHIADGRWALRVGAVLFGLVLLMMLGLALFGLARVGLGVVLALVAVVGLARGQQTSRGLALGLALLTAALNLVLNAAAGSLLDVVMWLTFGISMLMVLTGRPSRARLAAAVVVFLLGFLGALALTVGLVSFQSSAMLPSAHALESLASAASPAYFADDFSTNRGWTTRSEPGLSAGIENGEYAIQLKQPSATFFAFPPAAFAPDLTEFDAQAVDLAGDARGTFGVACGYSQSAGAAESFYLVEIDPSGRRFSVLHEQGQQVVPLIEPTWQPIQRGVAGLGGLRHISVRCANAEIVVSINGLQHARVSAPGLKTGQGKMGYFVSTWKDSGPEGVKVVFDNVRFWQEN